MAGSTQPFRPDATLTLDASTASASGTLPVGGTSLLAFNAAPSVAFLALGAGPLTADATGTPLPPGSRTLLDCTPTVRTAAVILASGAGAVYLTRGYGDTF